MSTITITCSTMGTDIFTARSSAQTAAIAYSKWGTSTFSATTNDGSCGFASSRYYVSSFFFNKGTNSALWAKIADATITSATLTLTFSSVGSYTTNNFSMGKKTNTSTSSWGADSVWKTVQRSDKSDTTISYSLGSGEGSSLLPSTGAFIVGQLNYGGAGSSFPVSKAVLKVVIKDKNVIHYYNGSSMATGYVYYFDGSELKPAYIYYYDGSTLKQTE